MKTAKVIFGIHSSVLVARQERDSIRRFCCDVLAEKLVRTDPERDFVCLGENFHMTFLYGDVADEDIAEENQFLRSAGSIWLELKSDAVEEMTRKILDFGIRTGQVPDPHLYFQAPRGLCRRLVGLDQDLARYEGIEKGPKVTTVRQVRDPCPVRRPGLDDRSNLWSLEHHPRHEWCLPRWQARFPP